MSYHQQRAESGGGRDRTLAPQARTMRTLLDLLVRAQGRPVGLDALADTLYGEHRVNEQMQVRSGISRLRARGYEIDLVSLRQYGKTTVSGYRIVPRKQESA